MERRVTIEEPEIYQEDYQIRMLKVNALEGILPVKGRGMDNISYYDYSVSGKISMQALFERNKITGEDIHTFLKNLLAVIREVERYLLNIHCILLTPEYIFFEEGQFYFCYFPKAKQELWERFHKLTEYFVKQADYDDKECVRMVFILHKETMSENYSLEKIVKECEKKDEIEEKKDRKAEMTDELYSMDKEEYPQKNPGMHTMKYDTTDHEWIQAQHQGKLIMEETENMWLPVKRFLHRHKKPKWGDWDGLYIDEEDL